METKQSELLYVKLCGSVCTLINIWFRLYRPSNPVIGPPFLFFVRDVNLRVFDDTITYLLLFEYSGGSLRWYSVCVRLSGRILVQCSLVELFYISSF